MGKRVNSVPLVVNPPLPGRLLLGVPHVKCWLGPGGVRSSFLRKFFEIFELRCSLCSKKGTSFGRGAVLLKALIPKILCSEGV